MSPTYPNVAFGLLDYISQVINHINRITHFSGIQIALIVNQNQCFDESILEIYILRRVLPVSYTLRV